MPLLLLTFPDVEVSLPGEDGAVPCDAGGEARVERVHAQGRTGPDRGLVGNAQQVVGLVLGQAAEACMEGEAVSEAGRLLERLRW